MIRTSQLLTTIFVFVVCCLAHEGKGQDNPYTMWAQKEVPVSLENITAMVEKTWGTDDDARNAYMIELHCRSLNLVFIEMNAETADWDTFADALEKWTEAKGAERVQNWWEWPHTNWIKVESEYRMMTEK